jgi:Family of unknown function (DUF5752)
MSGGKKDRAKPVPERRVMVELPPEKAFYFYRNFDVPLGVSANSLLDFQKKVANIEPASVKFHVERGDFQSWLKMLGETDSARRIDAVKGKGIPPQEIRERVTAIVSESFRGKKP